MKEVIVDIADIKIAEEFDEVLITYSLGSCIGLSLYDPVERVGGLIHAMLPLSKLDPQKAREVPGMFVDTGVVILLQYMFDRGAKRKNLIAKVAGAASILDGKRLFNTGERNYDVLRKVLAKNNIRVAAEDVGGTISRTMFLYMEDGRTIIRSAGKHTQL